MSKETACNVRPSVRHSLGRTIFKQSCSMFVPCTSVTRLFATQHARFLHRNLCRRSGALAIGPTKRVASENESPDRTFCKVAAEPKICCVEAQTRRVIRTQPAVFRPMRICSIAQPRSAHFVLSCFFFAAPLSAVNTRHPPLSERQTKPTAPDARVCLAFANDRTTLFKPSAHTHTHTHTCAPDYDTRKKEVLVWGGVGAQGWLAKTVSAVIGAVPMCGEFAVDVGGLGRRRKRGLRLW